MNKANCRLFVPCSNEESYCQRDQHQQNEALGNLPGADLHSGQYKRQNYGQVGNSCHHQHDHQARSEGHVAFGHLYQLGQERRTCCYSHKNQADLQSLG